VVAWARARGPRRRAVNAPYDAVTIGGHRGVGGAREEWDDVGVLVMRGWCFLEDERIATP